MIGDGQSISIDGIRLDIADLGPAECSDNTMIMLPQIDSAIVSDIAYSHVHPWMAEGRSAQWLKALDAAKRKLSGISTLFPGHGAVGSAAILDEQASYLSMVRELVQGAPKSGGRVTDAAKQVLIEKIGGSRLNWPLAMILGMNIDGIAAELDAG